jgi:hypothetical protein
LRFSLNFLVLDLSSSLKYVVHGLGLRALFWLKINFILGETELTIPYLTKLLHFLDLRMLIKYGLTRLAENRVSGGELARVLQAAHVDKEYVSIDLLSVLGLLLLL